MSRVAACQRGVCVTVKLFLHSHCRPSTFTHVRSCRGHSCGVSHLLPVLSRHAFLSTLR